MGDKVILKMTTELVAPCGMNCALCMSYLAMRYDVKSKGVMMPYCAGCRPRGKMCAFIKKRCELILKNKVQFCHECKEYPCAKLERLDASYRKRYQTSFIRNLDSIKKNGITKFLKAQRKKRRCPRCGGIICVHNNKCFHCDIGKMKKEGELKRRTAAKKR